jgi:plasmid stabilization system protein ParE
MPRVIWSLPALQDVQRLRRFLAGKNADAARQAVKAIRESVRVLAHQPGIGVRPRIWSRSIESGSPISGTAAVALYHYDGETAVILAVRHQKEAGY